MAGPSLPEPESAATSVRPAADFHEWRQTVADLPGAIARLKAAPLDDPRTMDLASHSLRFGSTGATVRFAAMQVILSWMQTRQAPISVRTQVALLQRAQTGAFREWYSDTEARPLLIHGPEPLRAAALARSLTAKDSAITPDARAHHDQLILDVLGSEP